MAEPLNESNKAIHLTERSDKANDDDIGTLSIEDRIASILQIDDDDDGNKAQIINDLLENGRSSLPKHENNFKPKIFRSAVSDNHSDLKNLLQKYFEHQWEVEYGSSKEWFISFLKQYKEDETYECVLNRTIQHGKKYMKDHPILSIVLQILFEGIDDECLSKTCVFDNLWTTITNEGLQSIAKYSTYISKKKLDALLNKQQIVLYEALREYYRPKLFEIFNKCKIKNESDLYKLALDNVAYDGWLQGLKAVEDDIVPVRFKKLLEEIPSSKQPSQNTSTSIDVKADFDNASKTQDATQMESTSTNVVSKTINKESSSTEDHMQNENKNNDPTTNETNNQNVGEGSSIIQSDSVEKSSVGTVITSSTFDDKNQIERNIILDCIKGCSDKLKYGDLVQAGELQYMSQTLKDISEQLVENFHRKRLTFSEFIDDCLTPIMYLLKRLQNLDDFLNSLTSKYRRTRQKLSNSSIETTNLSSRMLLHVLLMKSDIFLRRIILSLISKRNPVPFISPNIQNETQKDQYEFIPAIIHVWDYTRPTILSFGIGSCQGKSTLLNQLFQSTFEQRIDSIYFQQTIDIDFGYYFNPSRSLNIADTHGIINKQLLKKIVPLFDGFLIQINKTYLDQQPKVLLEYITTLPTEKFQMIIIRDTPDQCLNECSSTIKTILEKSDCDLSKTIHIHPLINISNTNDRTTTDALVDLREEILTKIKNEISTDTERMDEVLPILKKLVQKDYVDYIKQMNKIIQPLKKRLLEKNEYQNQRNFPLYLKFQELCKLRQKLRKLDFYGTKTENMFNIHTELYQLENELEPNIRTTAIKCGFIFDSFIEILKSDNMLMSLNLLASELKSELLNLGSDKIAGDLAVQHGSLSLEVLWRNAIVCHNQTMDDTKELITNSYHKFVASGFPFEIIDGDNFHFEHKFLTNILNRFTSERILVISIIGPQNSGKSTLLNYMFGTLFDVRDGRCTRGIYGSLVKLIGTDENRQHNVGKVLNNQLKDIDYIMLIDTEGILGIEKSDQEYDRRLILFCLAVSHLVIINMVGDINTALKEMLTLCIDSLKQIGVNTVNQPIVHFVLNQKADPNIKNHQEAIKKIVDDLKEEKLNEIIDISSNTFHTLPSAFRKDRLSNDKDSPCFLRTEPDFIERTQQLCEKIVKSAKSAYGRTAEMFSDLPRWLTTAVNIFDTLQKFPDLTYFKDINERRQDDQIRSEIRKLMSDKLSATYREQLIKDLCELTEYEIRKDFQAKFDVHQDHFDNDLEDIFRITNASDRIRDRCRQFLKRQITEICNAWCTATLQVRDQKQMEALVRDGAADLRSLIDQIIKEGKTMDQVTGEQEFNKKWQQKLKSIEDSFDQQERLKQAITFIYGNYNIFEKECLPSHDVVFSCMNILIELSKMSNMNQVIELIEKSFSDEIINLQQNALEVSWKHSDPTIAYTSSTLSNFKYLNRNTLLSLHKIGTEKMNENTVQSSAQNERLDQHSRKKDKSSDSGLVGRAVEWGKEWGKGLFGHSSDSTTQGENSKTPVNPVPLRFEFRKIVHQTILNELSLKCDPKSNVIDITKLFEIIVKETNTIVCIDNSKPRPIEIDLIQKVVSMINRYFNEINLESLVFNLLLSKQTKSIIHIYVLILLTKYYYHEQKEHFNQQLKTLNEKKSKLMNYFISMVVPDAKCDEEGGKMFADQVKKVIELSLTRDAKTIIARTIQKQENLTRYDMQIICDGKLKAAETCSEDWLFRYIDAPTAVIVEEFTEFWKSVEDMINQQLKKEKTQWKNILNEFFNRIDLIKSSLANEGSSVQYIDDIFEASGGTADENLKNKGQCMVLLLCDYLSGSQIKTSYKVFDRVYTLKPKGSKLYEKLPTISGPLADLIKGMSKVDNSNENQLTIASIKNLHLFLESIMNVKDEIDNGYDKIPATFRHFDNEQIYNKLLDKIRGCTAKCPCCDRPCDVDHSLIKSNAGNEDNRHACQTGHQLRAMAGIKFEISNEASLFQCEELTDDKPIIVRGTKKKWSEFKNDHPDWDFGSSIEQHERLKLRGRLLAVWRKIGDRLCKKYDMKYVTENTVPSAPKPFHYILMLDASGSMSEKPWNNLLKAVNDFISIRVDSGCADRMTTIVFDHEAERKHFDVDIKKVNVQELRFRNGGTDFGKAFDLVIKAIQDMLPQNSATNCSANFDFIIVFMSDGQAPYPSAQLETLLTMKTNIHQFWTVALGDTKMEILEQINQKLDGTFKELKDSDDLAGVYAEIARN